MKKLIIAVVLASVSMASIAAHAKTADFQGYKIALPIKPYSEKITVDGEVWEAQEANTRQSDQGYDETCYIYARKITSITGMAICYNEVNKHSVGIEMVHKEKE